MAKQTFSGTITVASRIVDQLSSGLYESPAACLKELINNSYDADASIVDVLIKPDADRIIIEDDGSGMNREEFLKHFQRISESYKREDSDHTPSGRPKIGKIGIGFIAANEICDTMEIFSTKAGETTLLHVEIHFDRMRQDPAKRRRVGGEFEKADFTGEVLSTDKASHYTQIILKRVRAPELFAGETNKSLQGAPRTLYGLSPESIRELLADPNLASWSEFDTYSQNLLRVALNVPVEYFNHWIPDPYRKSVARLEREVATLGFTVRYDGTLLRKPVVLNPPAGKRCLISRFSYRGKAVGAEGYFYAQHGTVRPRDLQGLLLRIRHAAVGGYDATFLDFPPTEGSLIQRWISAEIWSSDELEDVLNIDRKTLRISDPRYLELQEAVHHHLRTVISQARTELYRTGTETRARQKLEKVSAIANQFAEEQLRPLDRVAARQFVEMWASATNEDAKVPAHLLRKFSVVELYELVIEVGKEVLSDAQLREFLRRLTQRLAR